MKVLFCSGFPIQLSQDIKGGGNWITNLINGILEHEKGIEIHLAVIDPKIQKLEFSKVSDIPIAKLPSFKNSKIKRLLFARGWHDPYVFLVRDFQKVIQEFNPDIIQIFGYESQYIRILRQTSKPVVIHFQGFKDAISYKINNNKLSSEIYNGLNLKRLILGSTHKNNQKSSAITSYLNNVDFKQVDYVMGRTDWDRWVTKTVSPSAHYFHCQEIIRKQFFESEWEWPKNEKIQLFSILKNSVNKNIHIIFESVRLLEKNYPDFEFSWKIAGVKHNDSIPMLMRKKGLNSPKVEPIGNIDSSQIIQIMKESHLFVLPSAIENSPNSLQEAMVLGMPVLATYAGGVGSLIEHGKTGCLVSEGEPYSLAGAIIELINDKEKCLSMGKNAREFAVKRNHPRTVVQEVMNAYNSILKSQIIN